MKESLKTFEDVVDTGKSSGWSSRRQDRKAVDSLDDKMDARKTKWESVLKVWVEIWTQKKN